MSLPPYGDVLPADVIHYLQQDEFPVAEHWEPLSLLHAPDGANPAAPTYHASTVFVMPYKGLPLKAVGYIGHINPVPAVTTAALRKIAIAINDLLLQREFKSYDLKPANIVVEKLPPERTLANATDFDVQWIDYSSNCWTNAYLQYETRLWELVRHSTNVCYEPADQWALSRSPKYNAQALASTLFYLNPTHVEAIAAYTALRTHLYQAGGLCTVTHTPAGAVGVPVVPAIPAPGVQTLAQALQAASAAAQARKVEAEMAHVERTRRLQDIRGWLQGAAPDAALVKQVLTDEWCKWVTVTERVFAVEPASFDPRR